MRSLLTHKRLTQFVWAFFVCVYTGFSTAACPAGVKLTINKIKLPGIRISDVGAGLDNSQGTFNYGSAAIAGGTLAIDVDIKNNIAADTYKKDISNRNRFDKPILWKASIRKGKWQGGWSTTGYTTIVRNAGGGTDNLITLTGPNGSTITATARTDTYPDVALFKNGDARVISDGVYFDFDMTGAVESGSYTAVGGLDVEIINADFLTGC